jgi:hypothetical protein
MDISPEMLPVTALNAEIDISLEMLPISVLNAEMEFVF